MRVYNLFLILSIIILFLISGCSQSKYDFSLNKQNQLNQELVSIPVDTYIVKYKDAALNSNRDKENIEEIFKNVNKVWSQAQINLNVTKIEILNLSENYLGIESLHYYILQSSNYDKSKLNVYFVKSLHGVNGVALAGNIIMIADRTTVFDFRALSHEIGHLLGLNHVGPINRLMARGVNGFDLTDEETRIARKNALNSFQ